MSEPMSKLRFMDTSIVTLTYEPAADVDQVELEHLVDVSRGLRQFTGEPLYAGVELDGSLVTFRVELSPQPVYGLGAIATGLVSRAISDSRLQGRLIERDCTIG